MAKKRVAEAKTIFEAPVKFGRVSLGVRTGSVGFSLSRDVCSLQTADELFTDRRLSGRVVLGGAKDANGQVAITEPDVEVKTHFDAKGFRVGAETLGGINLTFMLAEIELADVSRLSGKTGRLFITNVAEIPDDSPDPDFRESPKPLLDQAEGPWQKIPLHVAMPQMPTGMRKKMADAGLNTMGEFQAFVATKGDHWGSDIPGIGKAAREKLENWNADFWAANPQYSQDEAAAPASK